MRNLAIYFFAFVLCAPAAFGAGVSRVLPSAKTDENTKPVATAVQKNVARSTASRTVARNVNLIKENELPAPAVVARTVSSRGTASRSAQKYTKDDTDNLSAAVNTVGRNARVSAASINNNPTLRRAGVTLRPSTAEVGGRATIAGTDVQTGSNVDEAVRSVTGRAASDTIAQAKERLEQTAELNKSCQEQYNDCMDQFCAVVDSNQGRCSCSANLSKYTKVEEAVKDANAQLNTVAQRIRYVGLSADEIRAILNETEAEAALSGQTDTSETRNMLAEIESMIKDPTNHTSSYSETSFGLDMNLDFSAESADMFSLDFLNTSTANSFSNLRGADLYSAARNRCSTILNQCKSAGATSNQITGNYDLAIDKDCIAYEKGLKKMNDTLVSNVRSAELMLQKARLAVLQNKNQYDAKGCIAALDTCMRDDMVCGDDYFKCVDPTKRYIDENGNVVLGQNITLITEFMEMYNNAKIDEDFLADAKNVTISEDNCKDASNDGSCVARYLLDKIGTGERATDGGLCRAVLDKCQYYTYRDGKYQYDNDIVVNYIQRAMVNIRAAQQNIISRYASSCMVDVAQCYNNQVTQVNAWSSSASISSVYDVMRGACRNVALTCGYAIFAGPPAIDPNTGTETPGCATEQGCDAKCSTDPTSEECEACKRGAYVDCISNMFYESLLCPDNSVFTGVDGTCVSGSTDENCKAGGLYQESYVNARCKCLDGYVVHAGYCKPKCGNNMEYNSAGICTCKPGYTKDTDGNCYQTETTE